eukprot:GGOE01018927.1.p1 GENE.GGOE01018927.1~~GGOE01018927.1.p1  ORF type:complete len:923 (+),score=223.20 GGOE01018927.1:103-2871(+)
MGGFGATQRCLRCDPAAGSYLNGSVAVSAAIGENRSSGLCPRDSQCVRGCCIACLLGSSCPKGTVAPTGHYTDNVCPAGHRCDSEDRRPRRCAAGLFCRKGGLVVNCSLYVERARNATTGQSTLDGSYCEAGAKTMGWCPRGYYCPTPDRMLLCPEGHFCPNRSATPIPCQFRPTCGKGRWKDRPVFWAQGAMLGAVLVWLGLCLLQRWGTPRRQPSPPTSPLSSAPVAHTINGTSAQDGKKSPAKLPSIMAEATAAAVPPMAMALPKPLQPSLGFEVAFSDLSLYVPIGGSPVPVLCNVTATVPARSVTAVMGGSGSGKTSLLNALCGRAFYGTVSGEVLLNGIPTRIEDRTDIVGFVPQDDILHADLTVMENLLYSGLFQLPRGTPFAAVKWLAEKTIAELELGAVSDLLVGSPEARCISGGQRKRVNIGVELMVQPQLLFLDEPTSGLDAAASFQICGMLSQLAAEGVTVVTVVHQPRYAIFTLFDHLILLGFGGHAIYVGPPSGVVEYFLRLGFPFPAGENPADYMLDVASGAVSACGDSKLRPRHTEAENAQTKRGRSLALAAAWEEHARQRRPPPPVQVASGWPLRCIERPTLLQQYKLFCWRLATQRARGARVFTLDTAFVLFATYTVTLISGVLNPMEPMSEQFEFCMLQGLLFSVLITLASLRPFADNKLIFYREASAGYSISAFFFAQVSLDVVEHGMQALLVAIVHFEVRGSRCGLCHLIVLYQLVALFCSGWAYIFSFCVPRPNLLVFSGIWTSSLGTLLSGVLSFLHFEDIYKSTFLQVLIGMLSSVRWFTEWLIVSEDRTWPAQYSYTTPPYVLDSWALGRNDRGNVVQPAASAWYFNAGTMLAVGVGLRVVAFALIHLVGRERMNKRSVATLLREGSLLCGAAAAEARTLFRTHRPRPPSATDRLLP